MTMDAGKLKERLELLVLGADKWPNGQGAITNYLNEGHAIRKPRTVSSKYRSRVNMLFVPGKKFYQNTESDAQRIALREAQKWTATTAKKLNQG